MTDVGDVHGAVCRHIVPQDPMARQEAELCGNSYWRGQCDTSAPQPHTGLSPGNGEEGMGPTSSWDI